MKPIVHALAGLFAGAAVASLAETNVANRIDAGLWEVTATVTSGGKAGTPNSARRCLTSEEAARGAEAMLLNTRPDCTTTRSTMADGKLDALLQCAAGTERATTIAIRARFAPKSYEAASDITAASGGATTRIDMTGKWVGACSS